MWRPEEEGEVWRPEEDGEARQPEEEEGERWSAHAILKKKKSIGRKNFWWVSLNRESVFGGSH